MEKAISVILILVNLVGMICLVYYGRLFLSGNTIVDAPDAMLPMSRWDRGGISLTLGFIPLLIANILGHIFIQMGSKKSRLIIFIPSIICFGLVVAYWMKSPL